MVHYQVSELKGSPEIEEKVVSINCPFPKRMRKAKVGDLVPIQVNYPIWPPFAKSATVVANGDAIEPCGIFRTKGKELVDTCALACPLIGVGYLSVLVKA